MDLSAFLLQVPGFTELSRKSQLLTLAYFLRQEQAVLEFHSADLRTVFGQALLRTPTDLTVLLKSLSAGRGSPLLKGSRRGAYSLSAFGVKEVQALLVAVPSANATPPHFLAAALPHLERLIGRVSDQNRREFLAEALTCLSAGARRATIVMVWLVALDHLIAFVLAQKLAEFNSAIAKRSDKYGKLQMAQRDDFGDLPESVFIEVLRSAGVISNDVRKILDEKLGVRNTAAHPSQVAIHDAKVATFIEDLVDNVLLKYVP